MNRRLQIAGFFSASFVARNHEFRRTSAFRYLMKQFPIYDLKLEGEKNEGRVAFIMKSLIPPQQPKEGG
jgi:hypothetical protein